MKLSQEKKQVTVRNNGDEMINKKRKKRKEETDNSHSVDFQSSSIRPLRQSNRLKKIEPIESSNYNDDDDFFIVMISSLLFLVVVDFIVDKLSLT